MDRRKNIIIDTGLHEQNPERLPELATDLVRLKIDLIVVSSRPTALAAQERHRYGSPL